MIIFNKPGSKERLFEMMSKVNKITLTEAVIPVGTKVPLKGLTIDKLGFELTPETTKRGERYNKVNTEEYFPSHNEGDAKLLISTDIHFNDWYKDFVEWHGDEGFLVKKNKTDWEIEGNDRYSKWKEDYSKRKAADLEREAQRGWSIESVIREESYDDNYRDTTDSREMQIDEDNSGSIPTEPQEDDCIVSSNGWKLSVSCGGKFIGEFEEDEQAYAAVREWKKRNNWYPNTWFISDHGNVSLVDDYGNMIGESINSDTTHDPNKTNIRDSKGNIPKVGDIIVYENGDIGKILSVDNDTMEVDFRSHYLTLNTKSEFEIIKNPSEKIKRAFNIDESNAKLAKIKSSNPALYNQLMVAKKTMKMSDAMATIMGGMSKEEARKLLLKHGMLKETNDTTSSIDGDYTKDNENYKKSLVKDLKNRGVNVSSNDSVNSLEKKDGLFKENVDSVVDFDRAYLDNSVDTEDTNVSKYDGGLDYPANPLRVDSDLLHNEPLFEMDDFRPLTLVYDYKGNWIPSGHEEKGVAIKVIFHPEGSDNEKYLIVKLLPEGGVDKIYDIVSDWEKAKEELKKYL